MYIKKKELEMLLHRKKTTLKIFLWLLLGTITSTTFGATIGSDTAPQSYPSQINLTDATNRIAYFAALQGGFSMDTSGVSVTFDSTFPASGNINLQNGTLTLNRDLITQDVTLFTPGNIIGNNHTLDWAQSVTYIPMLPPRK
ncbi:MAG: hypothetical protein U1E13_15065 [Methylophilaceae bacterium]|nr:hypothetical protein [Methylophilaceae bacterium]